MTFTIVQSLPARQRSESVSIKDVQSFIEEFMDTEAKFARVDFSEYEYVDYWSAYTALWHAVKISGRPVKVRCVNMQPYFVRTDMDE